MRASVRAMQQFAKFCRNGLQMSFADTFCQELLLLLLDFFLKTQM